MKSHQVNPSPQKQRNITLSFSDFMKIKNGITNTINDITEGEEKDYIKNDLENILKIINEIEQNKEEEENKIIKKEYENGIYEGKIINGVREGKGKMIWKDGDRYEGEWKNGKFDGMGIYYFNNGDRYEGEFRNDN